MGTPSRRCAIRSSWPHSRVGTTPATPRPARPTGSSVSRIRSASPASTPTSTSTTSHTAPRGARRRRDALGHLAGQRVLRGQLPRARSRRAPRHRTQHAVDVVLQRGHDRRDRDRLRDGGHARRAARRRAAHAPRSPHRHRVRSTADRRPRAPALAIRGPDRHRRRAARRMPRRAACGRPRCGHRYPTTSRRRRIHRRPVRSSNGSRSSPTSISTCTGSTNSSTSGACRSTTPSVTTTTCVPTCVSSKVASTPRTRPTAASCSAGIRRGAVGSRRRRDRRRGGAVPPRPGRRSLSRTRDRLFAPRTHGGAAWATTIVRVVTGVLFVTFSIGKFADHAEETADFEHYGIPVPEVATYLVGALELVGGVLLVVGLFTRPAAFLLGVQPGRRDRHRRTRRRRLVPPGCCTHDAGGDALPRLGRSRAPRARRRVTVARSAHSARATSPLRRDCLVTRCSLTVPRGRARPPPRAASTARATPGRRARRCRGTSR